MIYQDDGRVVPSDKVPAGFPTAREIIRFSPSQVRLDAGESQKVRILIKTSDRLTDGEYRVHARLFQLPNVADVKEPAAKANTVAGVIGVEQAVAIPVIVRRGVTQATGSIASLKLIEGKSPGIDLKLGRVGNRSLYTTLVLKDPAGKVAQEVKGVAVPVPNEQRRYLYPLGKVTPAALKTGGYTLEMIDHESGQVIDKKPVR